MASPLKGSISGAFPMRWGGIRYIQNGMLVDPRPLVTVQFQLIAPGTPALGAWAPGAWDGYAPTPEGPFAATIDVGVGTPDPVNPDVAGTYELMAQFAGNDNDGPIFVAGILVLTSP
jgi:hypothetical protein